MGGADRQREPDLCLGLGRGPLPFPLDPPLRGIRTLDHRIVLPQGENTNPGRKLPICIKIQSEIKIVHFFATPRIRLKRVEVSRVSRVMIRARGRVRLIILVSHSNFTLYFHT